MKKNYSWEEKIISPFEALDMGHEDILKEHRDWLLGGENNEWRYTRSKLDGALILERR
jgi:hypothetical protein